MPYLKHFGRHQQQKHTTDFHMDERRKQKHQKNGEKIVFSVVGVVDKNMYRKCINN